MGKLSVPTIHMNGSGKARLLDQVTEAGQALYEAILKLEEASPNGRDYYPQGDSAFRKAEAEHRSRWERLTSVRKELQDLAVAISRGGHSASEGVETKMSRLQELTDLLRGRTVYGGILDEENFFEAEGVPMTGQEMEAQIRAALDPIFAGWFFHVTYEEGGLGTNLYIRAANVEIERARRDNVAVPNAKTQAQIHVWPAVKVSYDEARKPWNPAPAKLKAESGGWTTRGLFRAKTGTPQQIVKYIIDFFMKNAEAFKTPNPPR